MKTAIGVITLLLINLCNAQTGSWSWVRVDRVLNPSGLEVENFNAQFDLLDWNGDGLWDFVVNNDRTLQLFVGIKAAQEMSWQKQSSSFPEVAAIDFALYEPLAFEFVDFDNDNDFDLAADGGQFWWNAGNNANPVWLKDDSVLFDLRELTRYSFVDYDHDGDFDVAAGFYYSIGEFYWNTTGGTQPHWVADSTDISMPLAEFLFSPRYQDIDGDEDYDLFAFQLLPSDPVACYRLFFLLNKGNLFAPVWQSETSTDIIDYYCAYFSGPSYEMVDFDDDGDVDIVTRGEARDFLFYKNSSSVDSVFFDNANPKRLGPIIVESNAMPFLFDKSSDGALDLIVSENYYTDFIWNYYYEGRLLSFANTRDAFDLNDAGNGWFKNPYPVQVANFAKQFHLNFNDFDRDADNDYLFSYYRMTSVPYDEINESRIFFYTNMGTDVAPNWVVNNSLFAQFDKSPELFWAPNLIDIDNDGDDEVFIKRREGFFFYEQVAADSSLQWQVEKRFMSGIQPSDSHYLATFADLTRDGLPDLIFGEEDGTLSFYENTGSPTFPSWELDPQVFAGIDVDSLAAPAFGDMDHDGRLDMFVGNANGKIFFYRNGSTVDVEQTHNGTPIDFQLSYNYPNPFNTKDAARVTTFDFQLPRPSLISLKIYNILGQEIKPLLDDHFQAGRHHIQWDGRDQFAQPVAAGIYLVSLRAGDFVQTKKLTLIR